MLLLVLFVALLGVCEGFPPQKKLQFPDAMVGTGRILCPGCKEDEVTLFYSKKDQKMKWSTPFFTQVVDKDGVYFWNETKECNWDWWTFEHFMEDYSDFGFRYVGEWIWTTLGGAEVQSWIGAEFSRTIVTMSLDKQGLIKAIGTINEETLKRSGAQYELSWFDETKAEEPSVNNPKAWDLESSCAGKMAEGKKRMEEEMKKMKEQGGANTASRMAKAVAHQRSLHHNKAYAVQQTTKPSIPTKAQAPKAPFDHHLQADVDQELFRGIVTYDMTTMTRKNNVLPTQKLQGKYLRDSSAQTLGFEISLNPKVRVPENELERDVFIITKDGAFMSRRGYCNTNTTLTWQKTDDQMKNLDFFSELKIGGTDYQVWVGEVYGRPMVTVFDKATTTEQMFYTAGYVKMQNGGIFRMVDEWTMSKQDRSKPLPSKLFTVPEYCTDIYKATCHEDKVVECMEGVIKQNLFTVNECEVLFLAHQCHKNGICKSTQQKVCTHFKNSGCGDCETDWY